MRKRKRSGHNGQAIQVAGLTFTEAYRDASYAIMLKLVEGMLSDPKRRKVIEDLTIALLESMLEELKGKSSN